MDNNDAVGLNAFCNDYDSLYLMYKVAEKNGDVETMESIAKELVEKADKLEDYDLKDGDEFER